MRRARWTTITCLVVATVLAFGRPALADDPQWLDPIWETSFAEPDGVPIRAEEAIDDDQPHTGGFTPPAKRLNARPETLGAGAYDQVPASVDLRPYAPAVGDQGSIGACVAWTLTRSIMGYYAGRTGGVDTPYAPLYLYMRNVAAGGAPTSGLNPDAVLANLQAYGVDSQDDYWQGVSNYKAAPTSAQIANAGNYKISSWTRLFSGANQGVNAKTAIMESLAKGMPVAVGFPVYRDFMNLGPHTLYDTTSGSSLGGHMVTAFGYDSDGVWLRNQWGTGWGNSGDAKVSWAFVQTVMTAAYIVGGISTPDSAVSIAPQVTQLSVSRGPAGTSVTILGSGLARATAVTFGGTRASFSPSVVNGVTRLVAVAPARSGGTTGIAVTNPAGTSPDTGADDYTYPQATPTISGLSPNSGTLRGGTTVTMTGADLGAASKVTIGGVAVTPSTVTDSSLTFVTPAAPAGPVSVSVTTSGGTSSSARFTYLAANVPVVTAVSPNTGRAGATTQVVLSGTNLDEVTAVTVDGSSAGFARVSATQLRVNLPARPAGAADIQVFSPSGSSVVGSGSRFTYVAPAVPVITRLSPSSGASTATTGVTVYGENLTNVTRVTLGGTSLSYTMVDAGTLRVFVTARAAGAASLVITTGGGTSNSATFTAVAPAKPVISSLSPAVGLFNASTTVTVTGSGFTGATRISLGGAATTFTRVSDTRLTFIAKPHRAGALPVVVVGPGGTSAGRTFTYKNTLVPYLGSLSPNTGSTTSNTATVLTGRYLTGASLVTADGKRVSFKRISDTQINLTLVRRAAGTVTIKVKTSGGTSNGLTFRYQAPPAPVVTSLTPSTGTAGQTATVTVRGNYLNGITRVTVGGSGASFRLVDSTTLTMVVPAKPRGTYDVVLTNAIGRNAVTAGARYTYD